MTDSTIEVVSFDLDALLNVDGAVAAFLYSIALRSGDDAPGPGEALFAEFAAIRDHQMLLPFRSYKQVMWESLHVWCEQLAYDWIDAYADAMAMTLRAAQPFPDAPPALGRAEAAGLTLALVADTDHDVVCHSLNHLRIGFEEVVISEDARSYKPAMDIFQRALDAEAGRVVHVSPHLARDLVPARSAGLKTAWLDRLGSHEGDGESPADFVWSGLGGLSELVDLGEAKTG